MNLHVCEMPVPLRRALPDKRRSPNLYALKQDARPGRCLVCDEPLPSSKGKKPRTDLCGSVECKRVYDCTCWMDVVHRQKTRARRAIRNLAARTKSAG